jgi:hypothetical protein
MVHFRCLGKPHPNLSIDIRLYTATEASFQLRKGAYGSFQKQDGYFQVLNIEQ